MHPDPIARQRRQGTEGPSTACRGRGYCSHCSRKQTALQCSSRASQAGAVVEEEVVRHSLEQGRHHRVGKGIVAGAAAGPGSHSHMDGGT